MSKHNQKGRTKHAGRFVALPHYILETFAWSQLSPTARGAWIEFARLYHGDNNGRLAMSSRTLGERLNVSHITASRAIRNLTTFGFIALVKASSFSQKRLAAEYRMTHLKDDVTGNLASKEFALIVSPVKRIGTLESHHSFTSETMN